MKAAFLIAVFVWRVGMASAQTRPGHSSVASPATPKAAVGTACSQSPRAEHEECKLRQDICHAWQVAAGASYTPDGGLQETVMTKAVLAEGARRGLTRDEVRQRVEVINGTTVNGRAWLAVDALCQQYRRRYKRWPVQCCEHAQAYED